MIPDASDRFGIKCLVRDSDWQLLSRALAAHCCRPRSVGLGSDRASI